MKKLHFSFFLFLIASLCSCSNFLDEYSERGIRYHIYNTGTVGQIGSTSTFNSVSSSNTSITFIDSSHIAVSYSDSNDYGKVKIGTLSDATVTGWSSAFTFNSADTSYTSITLIDSSRIAVSYRDTDTYGKVKIGTLSGATITGWSPAYTYNSANTEFSTGLMLFDSNHIAVSYRDTDGYGKIKIGTISGTTITGWSSAYIFNSESTYQPAIVRIDSTRIGVTYRDVDTYGKVKIGTVSGTTITGWSSAYTFNSALTDFTGIILIDSNNIGVSYRDLGDIANICGRVKVGDLSGTTITDWSTAYTFNSVNTGWMGIAFNNSVIAISYKDLDTSNYGIVKTYAIKGVIGSGTDWETMWPSSTYEIKFGTTELDGTGSPDIWFIITDIWSPTLLTIDDFICEGEFLPNGTPYIIRQPY